MNTISQLRKYLNKNALKQGIEIIPKSSVVSWSYPGQFAYCLNEEFIWDKFGSLIDCPEIHFHKIQPVIRWDDFIDYFNNKEDKYHLSSFNMATISGGHIIPLKNASNFIAQSYSGILEFLTETIGLDKSRLKVTYFSGSHLSKIGANKEGKNRFSFEYYFPEDKESKETLLNLGLKDDQVVPDNSRDCFLIPNWICGEVAPWGYRNEINYRTDSGLVDIATVERLIWRPIYNNGKITGVEDWGKVFVINGSGLERLVMLANNLESVFEIESIKPLYDFLGSKKYNSPKLIIESARIAQRIIADTGGDLTDKRSPGTARDRKRKFNFLLKTLAGADNSDLRQIFTLNADLNPDYPELKGAVDLCLNEVENYRKRSVESGYKFKIKNNLNYA